MNNILFYTCAVVGNKMWFVSRDSYFMNIDINTKRTAFIRPKDMGQAVIKLVTYRMLVDSDNLYWLEYDAQRLVKYSVIENTCKFYEMPSVDCKGDECFAGIALYNQKIYMFPRYTPCLIIFDIINEKFIVRNDLYRILNKPPLQKEKEFLFRSHQLDDTIFFLRRENIDACINTVIKYQLRNGNYEIFALSKEIENPVNLCYGENYLYILCADTSLYRIDVYDNITEKIYVSENADESFLSIALTKRSLYLLPSKSENIKIIDLNTLHAKNFDKYPADFRYEVKNYSKYHGYYENERYIFYGNRSANYILRIDKERDLLEWLKPQLPTQEEELDYYLKTQNDIVCDESRLGMQMIFESVRQKREQEVNGINALVGTDIWKKITKDV